MRPNIGLHGVADYVCHNNSAKCAKAVPRNRCLSMSAGANASARRAKMGRAGPRKTLAEEDFRSAVLAADVVRYPHSDGPRARTGCGCGDVRRCINLLFPGSILVVLGSHMTCARNGSLSGEGRARVRVFWSGAEGEVAVARSLRAARWPVAGYTQCGLCI